MPHVREQHWKELPLREIWDDPDYLDMNQYLDQIRAEAVEEERAAAAASQAFLSVPTQHPTPLHPHFLHHTPHTHMGWLRLVDSLKLYVSFAECSLFYRALM